MQPRNRRKSSMDRVSIGSSLISVSSSDVTAPPRSQIGESQGETFPMHPPSRPPGVQHIRAMSYTPRRPNRLSLSFPIAPSTSSSESTQPTPTSSSTPSCQEDSSQTVPTSSPIDANSFLVALAGQERRVLELKEELSKAEVDLDSLKKQWARHEALKKRAEVRQSEPLRSLPTATGEGELLDNEGSARRQSAEMDRRKALLSNTHKESRRKVLTGGHTRTLSLLSTDRFNHAQPLSVLPVQESTSESDTSNVPRSTTMPDTSQGITKVSSNRARHSYQGGVTHNAKQIAEDVKAGLWTFLEDLRQATVGEEAVNGTRIRANLATPKDTRGKGSKSNLPGNEKNKSGTLSKPADLSPRTWDSLTGEYPSLLDASGWDEMNQSFVSKTLTPLKPVPAVKKLSTAPLIDDGDEDSWSNWDSPTPKSPRWSGSTSELIDPATPSHLISEDRPVKIVDQSAEGSSTPKADDVQWPAFEKLTPSHLRKSVSSMMKEWEKSLTSPMDERTDPLDSGRQPSGSESPPFM